ncbi:MAG: hypothetical protein J0H68_03130 [Sphingobacteriia bacterium]|nr:hypothetical protein [Sphingobacteriia bacterium]
MIKNFGNRSFCIIKNLANFTKEFVIDTSDFITGKVWGFTKLEAIKFTSAIKAGWYEDLNTTDSPEISININTKITEIETTYN